MSDLRRDRARWYFKLLADYQLRETERRENLARLDAYNAKRARIGLEPVQAPPALELENTWQGPGNRDRLHLVKR